jgi:hypothetical protein
MSASTTVFVKLFDPDSRDTLVITVDAVTLDEAEATAQTRFPAYFVMNSAYERAKLYEVYYNA